MLRPSLATVAALAALAAFAVGACGSFGETSSSTDASAPMTGGDEGGMQPEGGDVGEGGVPPGAHCPAGRGAAMVDTGMFCVDSTEATVEQYKRFLSDVGPGLDDARCIGVSLVPGTQASCSTSYAFSTANGHMPVRCASWCNAYAYCKWANKRLCGALAPGGGPFPAITTPGANEWTYACTGGDPARVFPYGMTYDGSKCITGRAPGDGPDEVATTVGCVGGFPGLFDMSGNMREWVDACTDAACLRMGGSYAEKDNDVSCAAGSLDRRRDEQSIPSGIRCCADRVP